VLGPDFGGLIGGERNTARCLKPARDVGVQRLAVFVHVMDHGERLAESCGRHPLPHHVERGAFLAHHRDALAAAEGLGHQVDDHLALAGAGWAVDDGGTVAARLPDHRALRGIRDDNRRPVGPVDSRRGRWRRGVVAGQQCAGGREQRAHVGARLGEVLEQAVVVLQQIGARLREQAQDRSLLDRELIGTSDRFLIEVAKRLQLSGAVAGGEPHLGEPAPHGLGAAVGRAGQGLELVGELIGERKAALVEGQPDERLVGDG
jgi:hypothetical protein